MFIIGPPAALLVICFMAPRDEMPPVGPEIAVRDGISLSPINGLHLVEPRDRAMFPLSPA